ncbi:hypothetical protein IJG79_01025 [Candidatus Saccharibacteria bacterium]|nr:hypothetical protein [Candidatus Saccharibacteria bacterium]
MKQKFLKWCDDIKLAMLGIVFATKKPKFWICFLAVFTIFGTIISLLSDGTGAVNLFFATDFGGKISIIRDGFISLFGIGKAFGDWALLFFVAFLQALLVSLIALVWKKRSNNSRNSNSNDTNSSNVQRAGIAAGLALLGSGCPTCGTALITPIISSLFSSGSLAIAGTVSGLLNLVAIIILLWSIKRVGLEAYVIIVDEKWRSRHAQTK